MKSHPMLPNHFGHLVYFLVTRLLLPALVCGVLFVLARVSMVALAHLGVVPGFYTASVVMEIRSNPVVQELQDHGGTSKRQRIELENMIQHDVRMRSALLQVISDVDMLNQLVSRDPDGNPTPEGLQRQERLIARIGKGIQFRVLARNDDVMRVEVSSTDTDGYLASKIVNALVDNYIGTANAWIDRSLKSTKEFFHRQRDLYAQMLAKSEAERIQFMSDNPGLDPNDFAGVDERLDSLEARLNALSQEIVVLEAERGAAERFIQEQPEMIINKADEMNPELVPLRERRAKLAARYHDFASTSPTPAESHPNLQQWAREIAEIDEQLRQMKQTVAVDKGLVPNVERLRAQRALEEKSAKIAALQKQRAELEQEHLIYEVRKRKFLQLRERAIALERRISEQRTRYSFWNTRLRDADIDLQAAIDRRSIALTVLSRPTEALEPDGPNLAYLWPIALWTSIGVGVLCYVTQLLINATTPRRSRDEPAAE